MKNKFKFLGGAYALTAMFALVASPVWAGYWEGFETTGWAPSTDGTGSGWNNYDGGSIQQVASGGGIMGVTSSSGGFHAELTNLSVQNNFAGNPGLGTLSPYTRFGGYSSTFGGGFTSSLDVYLDPTWSNGQGFDFSTAASRQNGAHLRDFIWHVGVVDGDLLVNASNNSDWLYNPFIIENNNTGAAPDNEGPATILNAGWYTFETVFYDDGGNLSVDLNLYDTGGLLHSITRETSDDIATTVGGNRYGWFTYNNIDGLAIDNVHLEAAVVPLPGAAALGFLGMGLIGVRRRFRKSAEN